MNNYYIHTKALKKDLRDLLDKEALEMLHKKKYWKHFLLCMQQLFLLCGLCYLIISSQSAMVWIPCSIGIGFITFSWNPLLHEIVHNCVFSSKYPLFENILGYFYANMGGLSKTQFTLWHLAHHRELGSLDDPKRAYLTPKKITPYHKALYLTPALFFIYFSAAAKETKKYSDQDRKKIAIERFFLFSFHIFLLTSLFLMFDFYFVIKLYIIPYFLVFPIAFTINRLGQHYSINPNNPAHWTTLIASNFFWNKIYLYSNLHLEHHYFPNVPCYNLPKLQKLLQPLYKKHAIEPQGYVKLIYQWFFLNKVPHTDWT